MNRNSTMASLIALSSALWSGAALAQDGQADDQGNREIIVTAQRRAESVQSVPITIAAFDQKMVEASGSADITDLNGITPNVILQTEGLVANVPMFSIRGMSSADPDPNADPKISTIINGVYVPFVASTMLDLFDVERVEVLKGPQGVLFGKNNLAGTINIITKAPAEEAGGEVRLTGGSFGLKQIRGRLETGEFADGVLAAKVSGSYSDYNGYARNILTGNKLEASENAGFRVAVRAKPSATFDTTAVFDWNKETAIGPANHSADNGTAAYLGLPLEARTDVRVAAVPFDPYSRTKSYGVAWTSNLDVGIGTITAVLGARHQDYETRGDFDGLITPVPGFDVTRKFNGNSKSAELRFVSNTGGLVDYVIGAYAQGDTWRQNNTVLTTATTRTESQLDQKSSSYALFALANIHPTEQFTISLGGRYSWDKKDYSIDTKVYANGVLNTGSSFAGSLKGDWSKFTPRVTLQYKASDNAMFFANYSKGYKAGGFNSRGTRPENVGPYDPENVTSYEAGIKTDLAGRMIRFNLTGFLNKFKDLQGGVTRPGAVRAESVTVNVASAETWGIELETLFRLSSRFTLSANLGYLNSRYTQFCDDVDGVFSATNAAVPGQCGPAVPFTFAGSSTVSYQIPTDNTGLELANAPEWTGSVAMDYTHPISLGDLKFHADARYTPRYNTWGRSNIEAYYRQEVVLVNASLALVGEGERWSLTGYVKNLTNKTVMSGAVSPGGGNPVQQFFQPPREFGVEATFKF